MVERAAPLTLLPAVVGTTQLPSSATAAMEKKPWCSQPQSEWFDPSKHMWLYDGACAGASPGNSFYNTTVSSLSLCNSNINKK